MDKEKVIERYNPDPEQGLDEEIVAQRKADKLVNKTIKTVGKTYWKIIVDNVLNFFNILLFAIAIIMIIAKKFDSLFFLAVLIPNIAIGLYEDIHARKLMDKLKLVTEPKAVVIRSNLKYEISTEELVLDDIVELKNGMQISADSILVRGSLMVNESLLTGEPLNIPKTVGDLVYSGSYVTSGNALVRVDKVGKDSYVQTLQASAKKFKRSDSEILKSLKRLFKIIGTVVIILGVSMLVILGFQNAFSSYPNFCKAVGPISGSMVSMIPSGLYLLTSVALATAVIKLSQNNARVQDFYSVEMLARTDVLCVDKTGTITDGTMKVTKIVPFGSNSDTTLTGLLNDFVNLIGDDNATATALKEYFHFPTKSELIDKANFNSENKYSAATFRSGGTFVLGAAEFLNLKNKTGILHRIEEYTANGYRVLILAKASKGIKEGKVDGECEAIGMVILQDHIRPDAVETFKWFKENNVSVRVISGDDARTVSEIARQAGIENYDSFISLAGMSIEEVSAIATKYTVFGRVTPEQKEALVIALKEEGHTVAMTGDGVNDILALKRADCSIAMASGAEAAKNVSHIVLLDSNFDHLPTVVGQGRRVINNLQRSTSLFLTKTIFAVVLTVLFLIGGVITRNPEVSYPFLTNNLYIWEFASIGFASFFLALEPNQERLKGKFLGNVFKKSIGGALASIFGVIAIFGMYHLQKHNIMYTGVYSKEAAVTMCTVLFTTVAVFVLLKICLPFSKYRKIVFSVSASISVIGLFVGGLLSHRVPNGDAPILHLNFKALNPVNYLEVLIATTVVITFYLVITYIIEVMHGEHLEEDKDATKRKNKKKQKVEEIKEKNISELVEGDNTNVDN
ncbi:MAG: HAD-IC family P-type ATPase [Bacilli bacterium]|nr:HAD-IC family P-type ATPase [Bacilli bacterium]